LLFESGPKADFRTLNLFRAAWDITKVHFARRIWHSGRCPNFSSMPRMIRMAR